MSKPIIFLGLMLAAGCANGAHADESKNRFDLIEAAQVKGDITDAQAALYNAMALRGAPGLPDRFQGDPKVERANGAENHLYVSDLRTYWDSFTLEEQRQALNLMAPPAFVWSAPAQTLLDKSAKALRADEPVLPQPTPDPAWTFIENTETKAWYRNDDPHGAEYAHIISDSYHGLVTSLSGVMGRAPLADGNSSYEYELKDGKKVIVGNGGNEKFDFYIMPCPAGTKFGAYTMAYLGANSKVATPAYIVVNASSWSFPGNPREVRVTIAHEIMHAIQYAFPKLQSHFEARRIDEGVAKWSEDFVDSSLQSEHYWQKFAVYGWLSLLDETYPTWTFYYFLERTLGLDILRQIYTAMADHHPYDAIDSVLPGGFKKQWPLYTVKEWNQLPTEDSFLEWDAFDIQPFQAEHVPLEVKPMIISDKGEYEDSSTADLKPLTRKYLAYSVVPGTDVRSVSVEMAHWFKKDKIALKALVQYSGSKGWRVEDWNSQMEDKELCLDRADERILKLVLIYSNFTFAPGPAETVQIKVKATNLGCFAYKGNIKGTINTKSSSGTSNLEMSTDVWYKAHDRKHATPGDDGHMPGYYDLMSIKTAYTYKSTQGKCSTQKSDTIEVAGPAALKIGSLGFYPYHTTSVANGRMFNGAINHPAPAPIPVHYTCTDGHSFDTAIYLFPWIVGDFGAPYGKIPGSSGRIFGAGPINAPQTGSQDVSYAYDLKPYAEGE